MPDSPRAPVKFDDPPVVEVVCGVQFSLPKPLKAAHIGGYWDTIRSEFPNTEDVAPLQPFIDGEEGIQSIEFTSIPPLRRSWFVEPSGRHLVQLQEDRFLFNWKRVSDADEYPSYDKVIARFNERLDGFAEFLKSMNLGEPRFTMFEMTYVNIIRVENGLDVERPWRVLSDHLCRESAHRFLPQPEAFNWNTAYSLPNSSGKLHVIAQTSRSTKTGEKVLRLELAARGRANQNRQAWFDTAHEWITQGFADVTAADIQRNNWKRSS